MLTVVSTLVSTSYIVSAHPPLPVLYLYHTVCVLWLSHHVYILRLSVLEMSTSPFSLPAVLSYSPETLVQTSSRSSALFVYRSRVPSYLVYVGRRLSYSHLTLHLELTVRFPEVSRHPLSFISASSLPLEFTSLLSQKPLWHRGLCHHATGPEDSFSQDSEKVMKKHLALPPSPLLTPSRVSLRVAPSLPPTSPPVLQSLPTVWPLVFVTSPWRTLLRIAPRAGPSRPTYPNTSSTPPCKSSSPGAFPAMRTLRPGEWPPPRAARQHPPLVAVKPDTPLTPSPPFLLLPSLTALPQVWLPCLQRSRSALPVSQVSTTKLCLSSYMSTKTSPTGTG